MLRRLAIATFALPAGAAAQAQITRDIGALFQTDSLRYTLRATSWGLDGEIGVTFTNRTSGTVYMVNCKGATGYSWLYLVGVVLAYAKLRASTAK